MSRDKHPQVTAVEGQAMQSGKSALHEARLELRKDGSHLYLFDRNNGEQLFDCLAQRAKLEPAMGTAPRRVVLPGGHLFLTTDPGIADLLGEQSRGRIQSALERFSALSFALIVGIIVSGWLIWRFAVPLGVTIAAASTPQNWLDQIDKTALYTLRNTWSFESRLDEEERRDVQGLLETLTEALPARHQTGFKLHFVNLKMVNAFALPGGSLVVTDGLVEEFGSNPDVVAGVLAHELGHVVERHGLKNLYRSAATYLLVLAVLGDVGPVFEDVLVNASFLVDLAYSREFEAAADDFGLKLSKQAGFDPGGLVAFFESLNKQIDDDSLVPPEWLSTHPSFERRLQRMRQQLD